MMATTTRTKKPLDVSRGYYIATPEEGREMFDQAARTAMGMSGEEFIQRWEAGEFDEIADTAGNRHIIELVLLIPFGRQDA